MGYSGKVNVSSLSLCEESVYAYINKNFQYDQYFSWGYSEKGVLAILV